MRILIGFDDSPPSVAAVKDLARAGLPDKAFARIFTVIRPWIPMDSALALTDAPAWYSGAYIQDLEGSREAREAGMKIAERGHDYLKAVFPMWNIEVGTVVDDPATGLLKEAGAWRPDLLVIGPHGRSALGRLFLGSVARRVLDHAACPVRLGRPGRGRRGSIRLALALDGSPESLGALDWLAGRSWPHRIEIRMLSILELKSGFKAPTRNSRGGWTRGLVPSWPWMEDVHDKARIRLERTGARVTSRILQGKPATLLLEEIARFRPDTVFLGSRGFAGLDRFFMGGVSMTIAMRAGCSVEVFRRWPIRKAGSPRRLLQTRRRETSIGGTRQLRR